MAVMKPGAMHSDQKKKINTETEVDCRVAIARCKGKVCGCCMSNERVCLKRTMEDCTVQAKDAMVMQDACCKVPV